MLECEVCGRTADKHHIVYRCQGGVDFPLNFKYLCSEHHRGKMGPHKSRRVDLECKIEMQYKLNNILNKDYYNIDDLVVLLEISKGVLKRLLKDCRLYKEGYKKSDIIYRLMGNKIYTEDMVEEYYNFISSF